MSLRVIEIEVYYLTLFRESWFETRDAFLKRRIFAQFCDKVVTLLCRSTQEYCIMGYILAAGLYIA